MKIKQILVAFLFTTLVISCGKDKAKETNKAEETNNNKICSLLDRQIKAMSDVNHIKLQYEVTEDYFNTDIGQKELLRIQKEFDLIEKESDKFFEQRDGRTEADVASNLKLLLSCPKYDELMEYMELIPFIKNQMQIRM